MTLHIQVVRVLQLRSRRRDSCVCLLIIDFVFRASNESHAIGALLLFVLHQHITKIIFWLWI